MVKKIFSIHLFDTHLNYYVPKDAFCQVKIKEAARADMEEGEGVPAGSAI